MANIKFSTELIISFITEGILVILIPLLMLILWKKKTKSSLKPAITGMIIFPLFGLILKMIPGYFMLIADNPVSRAMNSNIWLMAIIGGGLLAGIFEEGGRFVAFKFILKKYTDRKDAISYGIGHGGFESAYLGISALSYAAIGIMLNSGNSDMIFSGLDEAALANTAEQFRTIAETPVYMPAVLGVLERLSAIAFHISNSVLVFTAANKKGYGYLFPVAILTHTVLNSMTGFVAAEILSVVQLEICFIIYSAIMSAIAFKIYKNLL